MSPKRRRKGEGAVYQRASDGRWVGVLELRSGGRRRRRYVYATTAAGAVKALRALREGVAAGRDAPERMTVGRWLDLWEQRLQLANLAPNTITSYTQVARDYIRPEIGRIRLNDITVVDVEEMLVALAARRPPVSPPSIGYALRVTRIALTAAERAGLLLRRNPASLVQPPRYRKRKARPFEAREAIDFLAAIRGDRLRPLIVLMLTAALRRGELLGLTWGNVHLEDRCLWVTQQLQRRRGGGLVIRDLPKTERSEAPVALTNLAVTALQAHRGRLMEERLALGPEWLGSDNPVAPEALVFVSEVGTAQDPDNLRRRFRALLKGAQLAERGIHAGRHTTSTLLAALGVPPAVVAQVLRHSKVTTTLDVYTHVLSADQRLAAERLDELLGEVLG